MAKLPKQVKIYQLACANPYLAEQIYFNFQSLEVVDRGTSSG